MISTEQSTAWNTNSNSKIKHIFILRSNCYEHSSVLLGHCRSVRAIPNRLRRTQCSDIRRICVRHQAIHLFTRQFQRIQFVEQTEGRWYDASSADASNLKKIKQQHKATMDFSICYDIRDCNSIFDGIVIECSFDQKHFGCVDSIKHYLPRHTFPSDRPSCVNHAPMAPNASPDSRFRLPPHGMFSAWTIVLWSSWSFVCLLESMSSNSWWIHCRRMAKRCVVYPISSHNLQIWMNIRGTDSGYWGINKRQMANDWMINYEWITMRPNAMNDRKKCKCW